MPEFILPPIPCSTVYYSTDVKLRRKFSFICVPFLYKMLARFLINAALDRGSVWGVARKGEEKKRATFNNISTDEKCTRSETE